VVAKDVSDAASAHRQTFPPRILGLDIIPAFAHFSHDHHHDHALLFALSAGEIGTTVNVRALPAEGLDAPYQYFSFLFRTICL